MSIETSEYLKGRRHNSQLLTKLGEEYLGPMIDQFNSTTDRPIVAEWSMNAKHQTVTLFIKMEDGEDLSNEAIQEICYGKLAEQISEWFAAEADETDCYDATYVSIDLGL